MYKTTLTLYFLISSIYSQSCGMHCAQCDNGVCLVCHDSIRLSNGTCLNLNGNTVEDRLPYCLSYEIVNGVLACSQCQDSFRVVGNMCVENNQNCSQQVGNTCQVCEFGYRLDNKNCVKIENLCTDNCQVCENEDSCNTCKLGYRLRDGNCVLNQVSNCDIMYNENKCQRCSVGYYDDEGVCRRNNNINLQRDGRRNPGNVIYRVNDIYKYQDNQTTTMMYDKSVQIIYPISVLILLLSFQ